MSVRRSYLEYLLQQSFDQPMAFGYMDAQGQVSYDLGRGHYLKARVLDGTSDFDRRRRQELLGLNASTSAGNRVTLAQTAWQYAPGVSLELRAHAAYMRESYENVNRLGRQLAHGRYGEWIGSAGGTWLWTRAATLEAGAEVRRVRTQGFADWYADPANHTRVEANRGTTLLTGGYAQQSWSAWAGRLRLSAGARWDRASEGAAAISPNASAAWMPWRSGRVQLSWGQYAQFPDAAELYSIYGNPRLLPARSTHAVAALEQRIGVSGRFRVQAYQRIERDLLFRPHLEARLAGRRIVPDNFQAPLANSMRGYARGIEFFAQRRTANRLTGWVSYSLGWARMRDGAAGASFFADQDQRHTVNAYLGYRIRPSVNLSTKWACGSGFPAPGYFERRGDAYFLSSQRNGARLQAYQRTDVRVNKSITFDRWKMTVYGEVVNVFNRKNYRFDSYDGYDIAGRAYVSFSNMFPVLPSAGMMLEF
jgi:outer membrane cobalamin receptor